MTAEPTARVVLVTNAGHEPPGMIPTWLGEAGVACVEVRPWEGEELPSLDAVAGVVVMGGPQSAYDDRDTGLADSPWLPGLKALLRAAVDADLPVLGICLGAQLLAEACGGLVRPGDPGAELGARLVGRRDAALADPLFASLPMAPDVVQWHWDEIAVLPPGAVLLASSPAYANQAFRLGAAAYGLQFHVEADVDVVRGWAEHDAEHLGEPGTPAAVDVPRLLAGVAAVQETVFATWRPFVTGWAALVSDSAGRPSDRTGLSS